MDTSPHSAPPPLRQTWKPQVFREQVRLAFELLPVAILAGALQAPPAAVNGN